MLNYEKYTDINGVVVRQNPLYSVMTDKNSFKKQRKTDAYTTNDIAEQDNWVNAEVVLNDGTYFSADLKNALNAADRDITKHFIEQGYTWVGDDYHPTYITATGKIIDSYKEGYASESISHNEIARGKLYGVFLKALEQNKLKEFLARPELLTKTNAQLMLNAELKVKLVEAIKFTDQAALVTLDEKMVEEGKTQEEIDEKCKKVVSATKRRIKLLDAYFKEAEAKISTVERKSNVEKFQSEINKL